jgi:F420-non-reducing hydrogenase iron-sulfur subunit
MSTKNKDKKVILFSCNWHAYSSLESAGINRLTYPATVYPIRLACLGRITSGIILKAFEKGADGVYLIGCPEGECQHKSGDQAARQVFQETRALLKLLGYAEDQLQYSRLEAGDGGSFVKGLGLLLADREPYEGRE